MSRSLAASSRGKKNVFSLLFVNWREEELSEADADVDGFKMMVMTMMMERERDGRGKECILMCI